MQLTCFSDKLNNNNKGTKMELEQHIDNHPKLELKLRLSPPGEHRNRIVSIAAAEIKAASNSMMLVGCPRCLMYVMLLGSDPKCPKCKSTVLLDFLREDKQIIDINA